MNFKFKRFSSLACVLTKSTPGCVCYDIYSARDVLLRPSATDTVKLDLRFKSAKQYVCRIHLRSGLSLKLLFLGVIDSDYRGNISVILTNFFFLEC